MVLVKFKKDLLGSNVKQHQKVSSVLVEASAQATAVSKVVHSLFCKHAGRKKYKSPIYVNFISRYH